MGILTIEAGETKDLVLPVIKADGSGPQDITGWRFLLLIKRSLYDTDPSAVFSATSDVGGGITLDSPTTLGIARCTLPSTSTGWLRVGETSATFVFDWRVRTALGGQLTLGSGALRVVRPAAVGLA